MGELDGKVALITGAARGQGAEHARVLAAAGADIVAVDVCREVIPTGYPAATRDELDATAADVEGLGRRVLAAVVDVRDLTALESVVAKATAELGGIDIVVANAAICSWGTSWEMSEQEWDTTIEVNLSGVWRTMRATVPGMIERGRGGSVIIISSVAGIKALPGLPHYSAAKAGLVGLANAAAVELAPFRIRVNTVHPWSVATPMRDSPRREPLLERFPHFAASFSAPMEGVAEPRDISEAVLWLASDRSRTVTGTQLTVDFGATKV
mgnify:CR=1 FL=1